MNETQTILAEMLRENTGAHLCDSGGAYGRHHERNAKVDDFTARPYATLDTYVQTTPMPTADDPDATEPTGVEFNVTLDLFTWLSERLNYEPKIDAAYQAFDAEREDDHFLQTAQDFASQRNDPDCAEFDGGPVTVNSYNGEELISQTIQFVEFHDAETDQPMVLLQIHQGCDVRGGYTRPRVFGLNERYGLFNCADAQMRAEGPDGEAYWSTDNGCTWTLDYYEPQPQLIETGVDHHKELTDYPVTRDPKLRGKYHVWLDADDRPHCPLSGGLLTV